MTTNTKIIPFFEGRHNVRCTCCGDCKKYTTIRTLFLDEAERVGAHSFELVDQRQLILFDKELNEVKRYYLTDQIVGKDKEWLLDNKNDLFVFDIFDEEKQIWLPYIGVYPTINIKKKHISFSDAIKKHEEALKRSSTFSPYTNKTTAKQNNTTSNTKNNNQTDGGSCIGRIIFFVIVAIFIIINLQQCKYALNDSHRHDVYPEPRHTDRIH